MARTKIREELIKLANARNLLDNGGFEIWQRGNGAFTAGALEHTADRWRSNLGGTATTSITRESSEIDGGTYSLKGVCVIGTGGNVIYQEVEDYNSYINKTISLSVRVKSGGAGRIRVRISDGIEVTYSSYNAGTSWETLTVTHEMDSASTQLEISIRCFISDDTFYIDNAMLVYGSEPVDFVPTPFYEEYDRCQRYYTSVPGGMIQGRGISNPSGFLWFPMLFHTRMATNPTVTINSSGPNPAGLIASNAAGFTWGYSGSGNFNTNMTISPTAEVT